jgi:hypothetical protein
MPAPARPPAPATPSALGRLQDLLDDPRLTARAALALGLIGLVVGFLLGRR